VDFSSTPWLMKRRFSNNPIKDEHLKQVVNALHSCETCVFLHWAGLIGLFDWIHENP
jgi:hypothetical protein